MNDCIRRSPGGAAGPARVSRAALMLLLLPAMLALRAAPASSEGRVPVHARAGLDLSRAAATIWAPDAYLVYLENDEPLDTHGATTRWGYLYYSPTLRKARVYSVRDGKILVAEDLGMKFEAPPIADGWIDSEAAYKASDEGPAREFVFAHDAKLKAMLLLRGAIEENQPDRTTWMLVYTAPNFPSLFVVIDATDGSVLRTWRG
jgi:hypothetical protein